MRRADRARRLPLRRRRAGERRRQPGQSPAGGRVAPCDRLAHRRRRDFARADREHGRRVHRAGQAAGHALRHLSARCAACFGDCVRRSCTRATSRRSRRRAGAWAAACRCASTASTAATRRPGRHAISPAAAGAPALPAVRHPLRRAVARPRALTCDERSACLPTASTQIYNGVDTARFVRRTTREPIEGCPFSDAVVLAGRHGRAPGAGQGSVEPRAGLRRRARAPARGARRTAAGDRRRRPERTRVEAILERGRCARSRLAAGRARRRAGDAARPRLLRAAVARRRHLQHDPRGDGDGPAGHRDARRRQRRARRRTG